MKRGRFSEEQIVGILPLVHQRSRLFGNALIAAPFCVEGGPLAIDSERMTIRIDQGKGRQDRYVMLSSRLLQILREWYRAERPKHWLFPGDIRGTPRRSSLKRVEPAMSSRSSTTVQRVHNISAAIATGQNCL
jgi:hypothetical protein